MKKFIDCVNAKINAILKQTKEERVAVKEALDAANARVSAAAKEREAAAAACDPAALHAAKAAEAQAADEAAMYNQKYKQLCSKYLVSAQENEKTVAEIRSVQEALRDECTQKIVAHIEEIEKIGKQYHHDQDALSELLKKWHQNIYIQPHPRRKGCNAEVFDLKLKGDDEVRYCIFELVTNHFYRVHRGLGRYPGSGSIWT